MNERVEYGRAFWTDHGERLFVDDEMIFSTFEEASEFIHHRWAGSTYYIVARRVVSDWEPCDECHIEQGKVLWDWTDGASV